MRRPHVQLRLPQLGPAELAIIAVTATATAAAFAARAWTDVVGLPLAAFLLLEGAAVVPVVAHNERERRARVRAAAKAAEEARAIAYAGRVAKLLVDLRTMREDTRVLPVVQPRPDSQWSTVYGPRSHPCEDGRSLEMWAALNRTDDTGDIATVN